MILIRKQHEPESLRRFRLTPGADFDGMPAAEKNELRLALIKEQGYICAYCMRRIRLDEFEDHILISNEPVIPARSSMRKC